MKGTLVEIHERQERNRRSGQNDDCDRKKYDRGTQTEWDNEVTKRPPKTWTPQSPEPSKRRWWR